MKMIARETAWRIFATEFNSSTYVEAGQGERAPSYVVTPLGAKVNRLFVVGVVTDVENIGSDSEPMWRARVSDPTGVFYISAGQYQPEAAQVLSKIRPPKFVAVIGKSRTYSPEEGVIYVSIRPETIKEVGSDLRDFWTLEAAKSLKKRLDIMDEAQKMDTPSLENLISLGANKNNAEGMLSAIAHYGLVDIGRFNTVLIDALKSLLEDYQEPNGGESKDAAKSEEVEETEEPEPTEKEADKEDLFLEIIGKLDLDVKGAAWDDIVSAAEKIGLTKIQIEETTNSLLDKGLIYEPVLGRIKKI
jgi:RPA family protein